MILPLLFYFNVPPGELLGRTLGDKNRKDITLVLFKKVQTVWRLLLWPLHWRTLKFLTWTPGYCTKLLLVSELFNFCVKEFFALLRYYAAKSGNSLRTFRDKLSLPCSKALNLEPLVCPYKWTQKFVPKRRYRITTLPCVISHRSPCSVHMAAEPCNRAKCTPV